MYYVSYVSIGVIPRTLDFHETLYFSSGHGQAIYIVPEPWRPRICRTPGHTPLLVRDARGCRLLSVSDLGHARSLHWVFGLVGLFVGWSCLLVIIGQGYGSGWASRRLARQLLPNFSDFSECLFELDFSECLTEHS
jgi:hypothetical protein